MNTVAMRSSTFGPTAKPGVREELHPHSAVPHAIINAPIQVVYKTLTGKALDDAQAAEMYLSPAYVRRAHVLFGSKVYVSYTLHSVPGGCQINAHVLNAGRSTSRRASRRATRMAIRQINAELVRLRNGLE